MACRTHARPQAKPGHLPPRRTPSRSTWTSPSGSSRTTRRSAAGAQGPAAMVEKNSTSCSTPRPAATTESARSGRFRAHLPSGRPTVDAGVKGTAARILLVAARMRSCHLRDPRSTAACPHLLSRRFGAHGGQPAVDADHLAVTRTIGPSSQQMTGRPPPAGRCGRAVHSSEPSASAAAVTTAPAVTASEKAARRIPGDRKARNGPFAV